MTKENRVYIVRLSWHFVHFELLAVMTLAGLLDAGLQLLGKCRSYVNTGCLTPTGSVSITIKTDVRGAKHIFSTQNEFRALGLKALSLGN